MKKLSITNLKLNRSYGATLPEAEMAAWIESCMAKEKWGKHARTAVPKDGLDDYDLSVATNERTVEVSPAVEESSYDTYASYDEDGVGIGEVIETVIVPSRQAITQVVVDLPAEYSDPTPVDVTSELQQKATNEASRKLLADTDWYIIRESETGVVCPQEIKDQRAAARLAIVD